LSPSRAGQVGGSDDVGEQHRRQDPVRFRCRADASKELLDLVQGLGAVAEDERAIRSVQRDEPGTLNVVGEAAAVPDRQEPVIAPVQDQDGYPDRRRDRPQVSTRERLVHGRTAQGLAGSRRILRRARS
jgi:hypothetical protein